jgi:hypothetical protein
MSREQRKNQMDGIDPHAFEFAVTQIDDGFVFESFGQSFLSGVMGYEFMPVGGVRDRAIDGLQHTFSRKSFERQIYQLSIEKGAQRKIEKTIERLGDEKIDWQSLHS